MKRDPDHNDSYQLGRAIALLQAARETLAAVERTGTVTLPLKFDARVSQRGIDAFLAEYPELVR